MFFNDKLQVLTFINNRKQQTFSPVRGERK